MEIQREFLSEELLELLNDEVIAKELAHCIQKNLQRWELEKGELPKPTWDARILRVRKNSDGEFSPENVVPWALVQNLQWDDFTEEEGNFLSSVSIELTADINNRKDQEKRYCSEFECEKVDLQNFVYKLRNRVDPKIMDEVYILKIMETGPYKELLTILSNETKELIAEHKNRCLN